MAFAYYGRLTYRGHIFAVKNKQKTTVKCCLTYYLNSWIQFIVWKSHQANSSEKKKKLKTGPVTKVS